MLSLLSQYIVEPIYYFLTGMIITDGADITSLGFITLLVTKSLFNLDGDFAQVLQGPDGGL